MIKCWICGDEATTREHIVKRSYVGKSMRLKLDDKLKTVITHQKKPALPKLVQSANSIHLKYIDKNLCNDCNSNETQPFDRAFDDFIEYFQKNVKKIIEKGEINLQHFSKSQREDLFRYFMKCFGCVIDSTKSDPNNITLPVPQEIIDAMNGRQFNKSLVLFFLIDDPKKYNTPECYAEFVRTNLHCIYSESNEKNRTITVEEAYFLESLGCLSIIYLYNGSKSKKELRAWVKKLKSPWFGKRKKIILYATLN